MGLEIDRTTFADDEYVRFEERLHECLEALREAYQRPGFGEGAETIGAELELSLIDDALRPFPENRVVIKRAYDRRLTVELDRFNLELNARPEPLAGQPFTALARQLEEVLGNVRAAARELGADLAVIGILPTLEEADLQSSALTKLNRYIALSEGLKRLKQEPFRITIRGDEAIDVLSDDVAYEGANTSFQLHLRVHPRRFAASYNAAQAATAPALAAACNAPLFLGRRLWHETRIALFCQSTDDRPGAMSDDWRPARVSFGHGWARSGALELFAESVRQHRPILPIMSDEDPRAVARRGDVPQLAELRLHQGTVWRWNRAIYDAADGGHVRVELRALPAGPSVPDMVANAAFLLGLTLGIEPAIEALMEGMTFGQARQNFYEVARHGLDAELVWPCERTPSPRPLPARELVLRLLDTAQQGLVAHGVDPTEASRWLQLVSARVERGVTGASWQLNALARLEQRLGRREAIKAMLERYLEHSRAGLPVHEWPLPR